MYGLQCLLLTICVILALGLVQASHEISPEAFDASVISDDRVWLVEFYSSMCGSCQEYAPVWDKISKSLKNVVTAKINVDSKEGAKLADRLGVFAEGLPNVRLFHKQQDINGVSIVPGMSG